MDVKQACNLLKTITTCHDQWTLQKKSWKFVFVLLKTNRVIEGQTAPQSLASHQLVCWRRSEGTQVSQWGGGCFFFEQKIITYWLCAGAREVRLGEGVVIVNKLFHLASGMGRRNEIIPYIPRILKHSFAVEWCFANGA